jgi:mono/diheme cytochrome c family protein
MPNVTPGAPRGQKLYYLIALAGLAITPHVVLADQPPEVAAGQKLAQQYCAECHVVVPSGKRGWTDAPAFEQIAGRHRTQAELSAFIQQPHMHMLNTGRPPREANDLAAYILTLRKD